MSILEETVGKFVSISMTVEKILASHITLTKVTASLHFFVIELSGQQSAITAQEHGKIDISGARI